MWVPVLLDDWIVKGPEDRAKLRFFELVPVGSGNGRF